MRSWTVSLIGVALLGSLSACEQTVTYPLPSVTAGGAAIEIDGTLYPGMAAIEVVPGTTPSRMIVLTTSDFAYRFHIRPDSTLPDFTTGQSRVATSARAGFTLERLIASAASEGFGFTRDSSYAISGLMTLQQASAAALTGTLEVQVRGPTDPQAQRLRVRFAAIR